ncbi:hypothetical protein N7489_004659 [Penicillium chrysogenum]|uniref:uncharacterized protein n=1 Tax=Penicillium chrysogenum TaxID=5076 RepID=UPI0024DF1BF1|nr:uncharacterized protein N7489_004659 [Penicillium chrysogenum]KAJ5244563.1 hypothetical protein N7489_004659 [Penicillium chrysogenum]
MTGEKQLLCITTSAVDNIAYVIDCQDLVPGNLKAPLFSTVARLEGVANSLDRPLSSERDLETYERLAVENHVRDIISELCKIPEARRRFRLGDGVWFESHTNSLEDDAAQNDGTLDDEDRSSTQCRPRPDQFCIHRADDKNSLLMTVEYKPRRKLTVENLRVGLQLKMDFWDEVVQRKEIPTDEAEKLKYNAEQIVGKLHLAQNIQDLLILVPKALVLNGYLRHPCYRPHHKAVRSSDLVVHRRKPSLAQISLPMIRIQTKRRPKLDESGLLAKSLLPLLISQGGQEALAMIEVGPTDVIPRNFVPNDAYLGFNSTACWMKIAQTWTCTESVEMTNGITLQERA